MQVMSRRTNPKSPVPLADGELVTRARAGDRRAFNALVDRNRRSVFGIAWSITGRTEDAEDICQDAFVRAFTRLGDLADPRKFPGWIGMIARNASYDTLARRKRNLVDERWLRERDLATAPESTRDEAVRLDRLWHAVKHLKPRDRAVVVLHHLVGMDVDRVADVLTIPPGTVKSRLYRSRRILKDRMEEMMTKEIVTAGPEDDFGRPYLGGMEGDIPWNSLLQGEELSGWTETDVPLRNSTPPERGTSWKREGPAIVGTVPFETATCLAAGDSKWSDYELSVLLTLVEGSNMQVHFRKSQDGAEYYLLDFLLGWQAVAISKMKTGAGEVEKISVVNFPFEQGREYHVLIAAREQSLTSYVDGKLVNQVRDGDFRSGGVALGLWWSTVAFRDPRIRHYH